MGIFDFSFAVSIGYQVRCKVFIFAKYLLIFIRSDFLNPCPAPCKCGWSAGKMKADCSYKALRTLPQHLRLDLQVRKKVEEEED